MSVNTETMPPVTADLFISYAWTSDAHREWVKLLAAHFKAIGYDVLIDADVDYGDSLTGFMRRATDCRHVLMIVDENYVDRADHVSTSGVAFENQAIAEVYESKAPSWLGVIFKENPKHTLPEWLSEDKPRGFDFNSRADAKDFPGSVQVEELWRWMNGLPVNRGQSVPIRTLRERVARLERVTLSREPSKWSSPDLSGEIHFEYALAPRSTFQLGFGSYLFKLYVSSGGHDLVYVYNDFVKAVGLVDEEVGSVDDLAAHIQPGRVVRPRTGDSVVLMNESGALCRVDILEIQHEINGRPYVAPYIKFRYEICTDL